MVIRPAEDWWMAGSRRLGKTVFRAGILNLTGLGQSFDAREACRALAVASPDVEGIVASVDPDQVGSFQLFPVIRYPHPPRNDCLIDLKMGYGEYLAALNGAGRRRFRRAREKYLAVNSGRLDFRVYRTPAEAREFARLAAQVTPKTYQWRENRLGVTESSADISRLSSDAERDGFRGYILFAHGVPIAYCSCYAVGDVITGDSIAYDPAFRDCYPGFALIDLLLKDVFADRFTSLHLGPGTYEYKTSLATNVIESVDVFFLRPTPKNLAWAIFHRSFHALVNGLARVKKLLRR